MRKTWGFLLVVALGVGVMPAAAQHLPSHTVEIISRPQVIDRIYRSMAGISDKERFSLTKTAGNELLWVTGGKIDILTGEALSTQKHLCHANMSATYQLHGKPFRGELAGKTSQHDRLFTFVQGQSEIRLPEGYGIPVLSDDLFELNFMVINPAEPPAPFEVKARAAFDYVRDAEAAGMLKPLFLRVVDMKVPVNEGASLPQEHCDVMGASAAEASVRKINKNTLSGLEQTYHWMVPPGRHEYRYTIEPYILEETIPFDTTVHFMNAHLHPHGETVELRDITNGRTLFKSTATNNAQRDGIVRLSDFSSPQGVAFVRGHEYEMIAVYNNTTEQEIDAMAIMYLYFYDKEFDRNQLKIDDNI